MTCSHNTQPQGRRKSSLVFGCLDLPQYNPENSLSSTLWKLKKKKYPFHQSHGMLTYLSWQKLYILSLNGRSLSFWANSRACSLTKEFQKVKKKNPSTPAVPSDTKLGVFVNRTLKKMTLKAETMTVSNVHLRNNSDFTFFPKGKKLKWKSTYFRFQSMLYTILNVSNSLGSAINFSSCV